MPATLSFLEEAFHLTLEAVSTGAESHEEEGVGFHLHKIANKRKRKPTTTSRRRKDHFCLCEPRS